MQINRFLIRVMCLPLFLIFSTAHAQDKDQEPKLIKELTGLIRGDFRYFPDEALYDGQHDTYFSTTFQPELYLEWNNGKQLLQVTAFGRLNQYDDAQTHADIRELYWQFVSKKWELSVGFKKIFWGVTESNHLVDIINQADALEGFNLEAKLGQPMVHFSWPSKWGTFDIHAMTFHRQMRFPGQEGRLRPPLVIDYDKTRYESDMEEWQPEIAARWSHSVGAFDLGLSHFYGASRIPFFETTNGLDFNILYELINQTGVDVQAFTGNMIWKGEFIHRISERKRIIGFTVGGEYSFSNLFQSGIDLGLIGEYTWDDRGFEALNALNRDFFFGARLGFNDRQSSDFLGGVIIDHENGTFRYVLEANRRLGESWKATIEVAGFVNIDESEFLYLLRNDSFLKFALAKYF